MQWAYPRLRSGDADKFRASELQHAVQDRDGDVRLGGLTLVRARAQPVADHPLEAADCGLGQRPAVIAGGLLPAHAAALGNKLQMLIPLRGRRLSGTMTRASGWHSATERETPSWSYAPSPVNEATGPATWSSKGPTCEPSSTSLVVSSDATIRPVSASTPMWSFRQDRRTLVPCFSISHSPGPQSFRPVLSAR